MGHLVLGRSVLLTVVLADKLRGCLGLVADLEAWVLRVDTVLLTGLAEISVGADRAHVTNTSNRVCIATVTDDIIVDSIVLLDILFAKVVCEHLLEAVVTVFLNFLADHRSDF